MKRRAHLLLLLLCLSVLSSATTHTSIAGAITGSISATPPGAINVVPNPRTAGESFGYAMAIDGDTLAVSAPLADIDGKDQQGAVYIFRRNGSVDWQQVKRITASDGSATDWFGAAVALHGDTLVVGAIYADPGGNTNQGAAYIFYRNQGGANNWGEVKKLIGSDDGQLDVYGSALAIHGDDLFVSSPNHDHSTATSATGMVYHYRRNEGGPNNWGEVQQLTDPDRHQGDEYGAALAFDGATLVVGAARADLPDDPDDDIPHRAHNNVGAAFIYTPTVTSAAEGSAASEQWEQATILYPSDGYANIQSGNLRFGAAVALRGDLLAVGAPSAKGPGGELSAGSVYLFRRNGGGWEEVSKIGASDPVEVASFGQTLLALPEGLLIYSRKGNGTLYAFQPAPTSEHTHAEQAQPEQAHEEWQEIASFTAGSEYFQSDYGRVLAADDGQIAVGAPRLENSSGGVFLHEPEEVFTAPAAPKSTVAYLPVMIHEKPALPITGQLVEGGKVMGPDGSGIAAPIGSIGEPINVTLRRTSAPAPDHEDPIQPVGHPYQFGAEVFTSAPISLPFIVALPVDAGVDPAHLALAALVDPETVLDADGVEEADWLYYEGKYDAANQRFLTTWPVLPPDGITLALVQHPSFDALTMTRTAGASAENPGAIQFNVTCTLFTAGGCTAETEALVESYLSEIHERMTSAGGFDYIEPLLRNLIGDLDFDNASLASLGYSAYIEHNFARFCQKASGYYQWWTGRLVLCLAPNAAIDEAKVSTLIHEYFHATQFAYPATYLDAASKNMENWIIEGMAAASSESYYLDQNLRRIDKWKIHEVDIPIDQESDTRYEQYAAQDFWVYVGKQRPGSGVDLGYLKFILQYGADKSAVDDGLKQHFNTNFKDQLWDWASNQIIEKEENLDGALGDACALEEGALRFGIQYPWNLRPAPETSYWPTGGGNATVPPYTTMVVQMIFPNDSSMEQISFIYPECENATDDASRLQCVQNAQDRLPGQMYAEGLPGCFDDQQGRLIDVTKSAVTFENVQRARRYFTVVTNVTDSDQYFRLMAELSGGN